MPSNPAEHPAKYEQLTIEETRVAVRAMLRKCYTVAKNGGHNAGMPFPTRQRLQNVNNRVD